jgi:hypothetical protein
MNSSLPRPRFHADGERICSSRPLALVALALAVTLAAAQPGNTGSVAATTCPTGITSCAKDGTSAYISRSLTYSTTTGKFSGTITTNLCPGHAQDMKFGGVTSSVMANTPSCITQTFPAPAYSTLPAAASLRGRVGLTIGASGPGITGGTGGVSIYGPMDAGFNTGSACSNGLGNCPAGTDVALCESSLEYQCGTGFHSTGMFMSDCGGHATPYHYHCHLKCEYDMMASSTHSPLIAVMLDGRGLYGMWEGSGTAPTDLDACGGHYGPVPATTVGADTYPSATNVYHYHVQNVPPFFVGCFGPVSSLAQAKALYPSCTTGAACTTKTNCAAGNLYEVCTADGAASYTLDCPVYRHMPSNETFNQIVKTASCPGCRGNCAVGGASVTPSPSRTSTATSTATATGTATMTAAGASATPSSSTVAAASVTPTPTATTTPAAAAASSSSTSTPAAAAATSSSTSTPAAAVASSSSTSTPAAAVASSSSTPTPAAAAASSSSTSTPASAAASSSSTSTPAAAAASSSSTSTPAADAPSSTPTSTAGASRASASSSPTPTPTPTPSPNPPAVSLGLTLRPAAPPARILDTSVGPALRRAVANATGLSARDVLITAIVDGPTGAITAVPRDHAVNNGARRLRRSLGAEPAELVVCDTAACLRRARTLAGTDGTTVVTELRAPPGSSAAFVSALVSAVTGIANGTAPMPAALSTASTAWAGELGTSPQPLVLAVVASAAAAQPAAADAAQDSPLLLSTGAIVGIVVGALAVVGAGVAAAVYVGVGAAAASASTTTTSAGPASAAGGGKAAEGLAAAAAAAGAQAAPPAASSSSSFSQSNPLAPPRGNVHH